MIIDRRHACVLLLLALALAPGCGRSPAIGPSKEAIKGVDALFTAVSMRDPALVARSEAALKALAASGDLPAPAASALEPILARARAGDWEAAHDRLSRFIEGQRR